MHAPHAIANCLSEISQLLFFCSTLRRYVPFMYSRASRTFSCLHDGCAAPIARTPSHITCADCPNEYLYQFGSRLVQPFGRQRWTCSAHARTHIHVLPREHRHTIIHTMIRAILLVILCNMKDVLVTNP
jgi:hypothetical protein